MKAVSIDPSLQNFGMSRGVLKIEGGSVEYILEDLRLVSTETNKGTKKAVRKNSDDLERARTLQRGMEEFAKGAEIAFVEIPHGSQSARSMASYGICIGILASLRIPIIQLTAVEVKVASVGKKTATKEEVIRWATGLYPDAPWLKRKYKGQIELISANEHLADAVAAVHAGILTDQFINAMAFYKAA